MSQRWRFALVLFAATSVLLASAGSRVSAQAPAAPQDHTYTAADVQAGSALYGTQCLQCHGPNGDGIAGVDLRRGVFKRSASDDDLIGVVTNGIAASGMPSFKFQPAELTAIVAYIRAGFDPSGTAVKIGNAARGKSLFAGKGACGTCHRVNGNGPRSAPDLSDVGALRTPAGIQRSLLTPSAGMIPINRPVQAVTKDGRTVRGRRLNEDTYTVQLIDDQERLVTLIKAELKEYTVGTTSPMPAATTTLSSDEVADVLAYLVSLKGQP